MMANRIKYRYKDIIAKIRSERERKERIEMRRGGVMENYHCEGGTVRGASHAHGGVKFRLKDSGTLTELEGNEIVIPKEILSDRIYSFYDTPIEVIGKILNIAGLSLSDTVSSIKSGDAVICKKSAWSNQDRKQFYKGTATQILSKINEAQGCNPIPSKHPLSERGKLDYQSQPKLSKYYQKKISTK